MAFLRTTLLGLLATILLTACTDEQKADWQKLDWFGANQNQPTVTPSHYHDARKKIDLGDNQAALAALARAIEVAPTHAPSHSLKGDIHRRDGDHTKARDSYIEACRYDPYAFRPHYNLGVTYQALAEKAQGTEVPANLQKAVKVYIRAIAIQPDNYDSHMNIGVCYFQLDKNRLAEQHMNTALTLQPESYQVKSNLGILYETEKNYDRAIQLYNDSLEQNGNQPNIILNLGAIYMDMKRLGSAKRTLRQAVDRFPENADAWQQLGICLFRLRELNESIKAFQQAIRYAPKQPDGFRGYGVVCMYQFVVEANRRDLFDKALKAWRYALKLNPNQADLRDLLAYYESIDPDDLKKQPEPAPKPEETPKSEPTPKPKETPEAEPKSDSMSESL